MTTIRDVAERAGVGLGTVSRVLNDSPRVSKSTRQRVLQAISDLDYTPSLNARRLSTGKTMAIAVIVPFFTIPSVTVRLRGIEQAVAASDYELVIYNVETIKRRDQCFRSVIRPERADGVIIISLSPRDEDIPKLLHTEIPIVLVDANHPALTCLNRVVVDDVAGGRKAAQHLIELGHTRIGFISDTLDSPFNFTSSRERYLGFQQALQAADLPLRKNYCWHGQPLLKETRQHASRILTQTKPPTAIFAASDTQAMGVLLAARDAGLKVPDELSVIGYDDLEIAEYLGLSTVRQLLYQSGKRGAELLFEAIQDSNQQPVCEVLPTELIERGTTAASPHQRRQPGAQAADSIAAPSLLEMWRFQ